MSVKRICALALLILLSISSTNAQGPPRTLSVTADRTLIVAGEQIQIYARTRDVNGAARPDETFAWLTSSPAILAIDPSGVATGAGLGTATVTAMLGTLRGTVSIEVLPSRVEVRAPRAEMVPGEQLQLAAAALNTSGEPIPNISFRWDLTGANGNNTRAASISNTGLLTASANAVVTAKASVVYTNTQGNQVTLFSGTSRILIRPKVDFKLTRLLTNEPMQRSFVIEPAFISRIGANDLGQVAFVGHLDGLTNGVMTWESGRFDMLASAGSAGPQPGTFVWGFQNPAMNNKGDVIVRSIYPAGGLLLITRNGANYVFLEGQSEGVLERIGGFETTKYSLNDKGEILFRANFQFQGTRTQRTALFKIVDGSLQLVQRNDSPLPGLNSNANYSFGFFGLDEKGVVYFTASDGPRNALYRADGSSDPVKIAATGDSFAGSTIQSIAFGYGFGLSSGGTIAWTVRLATGRTGVARLRPTDPEPAMMIMTGGTSDVFDVAPDGAVLIQGGSQAGWGLHIWSGDQLTPVLLNNATIEGSPIWSFYDGFITETGDVYAYLMTSANDFVMYRARNSSVAFKSGMAINLTANFNFLGLVQGARTGAGPDLTTGGQDVSIFELNSRGMVPIYVTGQRTANRSSWNLGNAVRNAAGDLYFSNGSGIFRFAGGRLETLLRDNVNITYGSGTYRLQWIHGWVDNSHMFSINRDGAVAFIGQSDNGNIVGTVAGGATRIIGVLGGRTPTASPAGGFFENYSGGAAIAIDDGGRVMLGAQGRNGPNGLFIYQDGQWRTTVAVNNTRIDGQLINNIGALKAVNNKFYAQFGTANGGWVLAEYETGSWTSLVKRGDIMPNGAELNYIPPRFDVNRNGEIVFIANMNSGLGIVLRTADGTNRLAYLSSDPRFAADPIVSFNNASFDLRDDRRFYFNAVDSQDRNVLYSAEPLF